MALLQLYIVHTAHYYMRLGIVHLSDIVCGVRVTLFSVDLFTLLLVVFMFVMLLVFAKLCSFLQLRMFS